MRDAKNPTFWRTKMVYFLVKWEEVITFFTVLCALSAIGLGVIWLFLREMALLYFMMGFSSFYFIGKKFWKFPHDFV